MREVNDRLSCETAQQGEKHAVVTGGQGAGQCEREADLPGSASGGFTCKLGHGPECPVR